MTIFKAEDLQKLDEVDRLALAALVSYSMDLDTNDLTNQDIIDFLDMELGTWPTETTVTVDEVRRTQLQFCTWKGGISQTINLGDLKEKALEIMARADNPAQGLLDASSTIRKFVASKIERTETLLRRQLAKAITEDNLEHIPGTRAALDARANV